MPIDQLYESFWKKSYRFGILIFKVMIKHMFNVLIERMFGLILFSVFEKIFLIFWNGSKYKKGS